MSDAETSAVNDREEPAGDVDPAVQPSALARAITAIARLVQGHGALIAIVLAGAVLRVLVNDVTRYSPADETHYLDVTRSLLKDGWWSYSRLVEEYLGDRARWLYPTPTRWGYLGMTVLTCAVRTPCDGRALAWLSTVAGTLCIVLTYLLGARLVGKRAALIAAAFTVTSPLQLALGRRALQDEVYCAVFLAAFWALVKLVQERAEPARARTSSAAVAFIAAATLAFAVKETFAFPYAGLIALYVLAPRGPEARPLGLRDALLLATPPVLFFAGFALFSGDPRAFFELLSIGQASFLSDYSVQYQSGPPHRPLFDLFLLAPVVCVLAISAVTLIAARDARREAGGERWLALLLAIALAAFMGLPKNVRFVVVLDPVLRLLAAWALCAILDARAAPRRTEGPGEAADPPPDRRGRWAILAVVASAVPELGLFHATFISHRTYDPTTHDVLRALDAVPRSGAQASPSAWAPVFFAASAIAVATLFLSRRRTVTQNEDKLDRSDADPEGEAKAGEGANPFAADMPARASDPPGAKTVAPAGAADADASKGAPANRERVATIAIAVACVVVALFIGRSCNSPGPQTGAAPSPAASANPADPAAAEMAAGLETTNANQAVVHFKKALEIYPGHYGATFQLARALDRAGRKDEATRQWQQVLALAQKSNDQPLIDAARQRLGQAGQGAAPQGDPMAAGLDALYNRKDPATAIARFREVLGQNPDHYGATFQLATAFEQAGDPRSAQPLWQKVLQMAEANQDAATAETARARLAEIDRQLGQKAPDDPDAVAMNAGIDALYNKKDPATAATHFNQVLAKNPDHYGATYQLATALDQLKKPAEARKLWEKMVKMADAIQDTKTAEAARARLAQKP